MGFLLTSLVVQIPIFSGNNYHILFPTILSGSGRECSDDVVCAESCSPGLLGLSNPASML
jgi:hypothetical protein